MNTEYNAAKALLEKGIKVPVTAPLCLRVLGKRKINVIVRQPYLGTLCRISMLYLKMNISDERLEKIEEENALELFIANGKAMAGIAALAILNGKWRGKLFAPWLTKYLYWKVSPIQLLILVRALVSLSGTQAFTTTIRLARNMKVTEPNLSREIQGS